MPRYILSDVHLGVPSYPDSLVREKKLVRFLEQASADAEAIYILGDLFDFWFEYRHVVPKGYVRLLGTLARIVDNGIPIHIFAGNHDMWFKDYFPNELGIPVHYHPLTQTWYGKTYFLAHGDGLGPGDHGYKALKKVIRNPFSVWAFGFLHPFWGFKIANSFSATSRNAGRKHLKKYYGDDEFLYQYAYHAARQDPSIDYFVFGHRHLPLVRPVSDTATLIILGDWISDFSYLRISEEATELLYFDSE